MKIEEVLYYSNQVKELTEKGTEPLGLLKRFIEDHLKPHCVILKHTSHSLLVSFYGARLLFRVEIEWEGKNIKAGVAAYALSYDEPPKEKRHAVYGFDKLGNFFQDGRGMDAGTFPQQIIGEAFSSMTQKEKMRIVPE